MPLSIRPYEPQDLPDLSARFGPGARAPWLRLPEPYGLEQVLAPHPRRTVFVAEPGSEQAVGLVAFDGTLAVPLLLGPLVPDEQLADLYAHALLNHAMDWGRRTGLERVQAKLDLSNERAIAFFSNHGFKASDQREYQLVADPGRVTPSGPVEGIRFGPSPEMLSSDYLRLYAEIGGPLGWTERRAWTRPQAFEHLQQPGVHLLSARAGETYLGFAELQETGSGGATLLNFGLLPAFRDRGIGTAFLNHLLQHAFATLELRTVAVAVSADDLEHRLLDFFGARGFRQAGGLVYLEKVLVQPDTPVLSHAAGEDEE